MCKYKCLKFYNSLKEFGLANGYQVLLCVDHCVLLLKDEKFYMCHYTKTEEGYSFDQVVKCRHFENATKSINKYLEYIERG